MTEETRKRIEEAAIEYADNHGFRIPYDGSNNFYDDIDVKVSKEGFLAGAEYGYKEAIKVAKEWLIGHTGCDAECNENGEPLADSYIKGRKLAIEIATIFESDMNELWEGEK